MEKSPVLPVTQWGISQVPTHQIGLVRLAYLTEPNQSREQATQSPIYGFSPQQLRALAETLQRTADELEAAAPTARQST